MEKRQQRQMVEMQAGEFEQAKEALRFAFYEAEEKAQAGMSQDFSKDSKPAVRGIILKFYQWPSSEETVILGKLKSAGLEEDVRLKRLKKWDLQMALSLARFQRRKSCAGNCPLFDL